MEEVIYPPVDTAKWGDVRRESEDEGFLVWGRLIPYKRLDLAILAARELGVQLNIVGSGPYRAELESMAAADAVRMEGLLPPSMDANKRVLLQRVPRGVVSIISPWNWPYTMPGEILAPAIAYGNAVVWAPAPTTSSRLRAVTRTNGQSPWFRV